MTSDGRDGESVMFERFPWMAPGGFKAAKEARPATSSGRLGEPPRVDDGGEPFPLVSRAALLRARARCARASSVAIFLASETLSLAPIPDPRSPIPHARARAQDLVFDMVQATCLPETPARIRPKRERLGIVTAGAVANVARGSPGFPVGTTNAAERIELVAAEILPSLVTCVARADARAPSRVV